MKQTVRTIARRFVTLGVFFLLAITTACNLPSGMASVEKAATKTAVAVSEQTATPFQPSFEAIPSSTPTLLGTWVGNEFSFDGTTIVSVTEATGFDTNAGQKAIEGWLPNITTEIRGTSHTFTPYYKAWKSDTGGFVISITIDNQTANVELSTAASVDGVVFYVQDGEVKKIP